MCGYCEKVAAEGDCGEVGYIGRQARRVFAMVPSEFLENFQKKWNEVLNSDERNKIKRLLVINGKTQRGNSSKIQKARHIVSAVDEKGFCLGQKRVEDKTNEIWMCLNWRLLTT